MPDDKNRVEVNLKNSICTDTPTGTDLYQFGDPAAQHIRNTGIERNGGIQNLYLKVGTFTTAGAATVITKTGQVLQVDSSNNVRLNNNSIGNVGPYAISMRGALSAYSDAAWSASNTIIGILKVGNVIQVDEYNPATGTVINTRQTTFTMPNIAIINVVLQKYASMAYSDSATFVLSNNQVSYSLVEASAPAISIIGGQVWTSRTIATATWTSIAWSPALGIFAATSSLSFFAATSSDGITWTTRTLNAGAWTALAWSPSLSIFAAVASSGTFSAATSPDGITWATRTLATNAWTALTWAPSLGLFAAIGQGTINCAATSLDGITWTTRTLATNSWNAVAWSPSLGLFAAIGQGTTNYAATSPDGITWTTRTLASATWTALSWSPTLGLFVAVGSNVAATSSDGITWTSRTIATATWTSIAWSPALGIFSAVSSSGNTSATSSDGITWTVQQLASGLWTGIIWSPSLSIFAAIGHSTNAATSSQLVINNNFLWQFATTTWATGNQGVGNFTIGNITATMTAITNAIWGVVDRYVGTAYSQMILTFPVAMVTATMASGIGVVGYNQAGTLSTTPTYYGPQGAATFTLTVGAHSEGPGYSESVFTRSDISNATFYYQAPIMSHQPGQWYDYQQQTATGTSSGVLCNGFGRLNDFNNNSLGNTCALRVLMTPVTTTSGIPTGLAAAQIGQASTSPVDCIGVPLTLNGEFDYSFMPHVVDNGTTQVNIIYRYNGVLIFLIIGRHGNLIDRGDCGSATAPMVSGETVPATLGCLWYWNGGNTWLLKRQVGAGNYAQAFQTSDASSVNLHGFIPGHTYTYVVKLNVPSAGSFIATDGFLEARYYVSGSWSYAQVFFANIYDDQQTVAVTFTVPVGATGCEIDIVGGYNSPNNSYFNVNDITLTDLTFNTTLINKVSDKVYMINCLSPNNCVDVQKGQLFLGANDYNGRIFMRGSGTQITTTGIVAVMQGQHAYSIDTGIKQIVSTFGTVTDIIPGITLPTWIDRAISDYGVNVYANSVTAPVYSTTYEDWNIVFQDANLSAVAYTSEATLEPLAMGYTFFDRMFQTELETLFLGVAQPPPLAVSPDVLYDYLGYMTGNQLNGAYQGFTLYGQLYLFDGTYIYAVTFSGAAFEGRGLPVAVATGLTLLAVAPTQAFFASAFDNSVYIYNGGRELVKRKRMNDLETMINGAYCVRDNALLIQTANHFINISDDIASYIPKLSAQTAVSIYDTTGGLVIANNTAQWNYTFNALVGSTPVALDLQTAYLAIRNNMRALLASMSIYLYSSTKAAIQITLTLYTMDTDGVSFASQGKNVTITPAMYDINGVAIYRVQPQTTKALALSLRIQCSTLVTITKIVPEFRPEAAGVSPADRSG